MPIRNSAHAHTDVQLNAIDSESESSVKAFDQRAALRENLVPGVRTVLVILSSDWMVFDPEAIRQKILSSYPEAAIFFRSTSGKSWGVASPKKVDLLVDLTGPRQVGSLLLWGKQGMLYALSLRRSCRFAVGRNAGMFRKKIYDRVFDERDPAQKLSDDPFDFERQVQIQVFAKAGIAFSPMGDPTADRARDIALELPPLRKY